MMSYYNLFVMILCNLKTENLLLLHQPLSMQLKIGLTHKKIAKTQFYYIKTFYQ